GLAFAEPQRTALVRPPARARGPLPRRPLWRARHPRPPAAGRGGAGHPGGARGARPRRGRPGRGDAAEPPAVAFAALRDGCIAMYPLEQPGPGAAAAQAGARPRQALPTRELTPKLGGGPALCCLPVGVPRQTPAEAAAPAPGILAAGYALGRLAAWELPSGNRCTPGCWEARG
ncbi:unnamed protein product, partial [Prorocentrum cordatum]